MLCLKRRRPEQDVVHQNAETVDIPLARSIEWRKRTSKDLWSRPEKSSVLLVVGVVNLVATDVVQSVVG